MPRGGGEIEISSKHISIEHKKIFFNLRENEHGRFLKIAEVVGRNRSTIIVPQTGWSEFRDTLQSFIDEVGVPEENPAEADRENPSIPQLFVDNLPWEVDDDLLRAYFEQCGKVESCQIQRFANGQSKGNAVVRFSDSLSAGKAIRELNNTDVNGRYIKVHVDKFASES
eukprot:gb/GECG01007756.1/.p1 GENE.gb/GECG01007756.1/~~gb/GECG01007756.1/.p1  ORF type:complete len:169 (+),score=21.69 gb/GECG01007756.1/:1-507(+)